MKVKKSFAKYVAIALAIICIVAIGALSLTGCANDDDKNDTEIVISGSSSVTPIIEALAKRFEEKNSNIKIVINSTDSGSGIKDTQGGMNTFGMVSRSLKSTETGIVSSKIATDGIALIVNNNSSVTNITSSEVYSLFTAGTTIQNSINLGISRESGSGTRDAFGDLIKNADGNKLKDFTGNYASGISTLNSTGAVKEAIKANTAADTLGYISLGSLDNTIKAVQFEGIDATVDNIKSGVYKLARPFNIVLKGTDLQTAIAGLSAEAKLFYDFIFSPEGQAIVTSEGCVSVL